MSFGSLSGDGGRGAQPGRGAGRLPAEHRRGRAVAAPPARRRPGLPDRHGVLRLPRRRRAGSTSPRLKDLVAAAPVRALEIKLQPGREARAWAGCCPAAKVTAEIAEIRGIPEGVDCISPSRHAEFSDVDSMLDFVELLAAETGLPVGIKSAVGDLGFWDELTDADGAAPAGASTSSPSTAARAAPAPRRWSSPTRCRCRSSSASPGSTRPSPRPACTSSVTFIGARQARACPTTRSSRSRSAATWSTSAREAMLAIGCIQAQKCHTDPCPTGVATQNPWLAHGLDPALKSVRAAQLRRHPAPRPAQGRRGRAASSTRPDRQPATWRSSTGRTASHARCARSTATSRGWGLPSAADRAEIARLMAGEAPQGGSAPPSATAQG